MKESYQTLLARCIAKGIVLTNETEPVNIRLYKKEKSESNFKKAGKELLEQFN